MNIVELQKKLDAMESKIEGMAAKLAEQHQLVGAHAVLLQLVMAEREFDGAKAALEELKQQRIVDPSVSLKRNVQIAEASVRLKNAREAYQAAVNNVRVYQNQNFPGRGDDSEVLSDSPPSGEVNANPPDPSESGN